MASSSHAAAVPLTMASSSHAAAVPPPPRCLSMPAPTFLTMFDPATRYPLFSSLTSRLCLLDLLSLRRTCVSMYSHISILFNADALLSRYVTSPQTLRHHMRCSNAIIGGSVPLQFLNRSSWGNSSLDIFVQHKFHTSMTNYILRKEGYILQTTASDGKQGIQITEECDRGIKIRKFDEDSGGLVFLTDEWMEGRMRQTYLSVSTYTHPTSNRTIRIFLTPTTPLLSFLVGTPTTVLLNFFSWDKAYSLFPLHSLVLRRGYVLQPVEGGMFEYSKRGWRYGFSEDREDDVEAKCCLRRRIRCVGDGASWIIKHPPLDSPPPTNNNTSESESEGAVPGHVTDLAMFRLVRADYHSFQLQNYRIRTAEFIEPESTPQFTLPFDKSSLRQAGVPVPSKVVVTDRKLLKHVYLKRGEFFDAVYAKLVQLHKQRMENGEEGDYLDRKVPRVWEELRLERLKDLNAVQAPMAQEIKLVLQ